MSNKLILQWLENAEKEAVPWRQHDALRSAMTPQILAAIEAQRDDELNKLVWRLWNHEYFRFVPRPDNVVAGDQQRGFIESDTLVSVAMGGNGSGKTYCGAQKLAHFIATTPPPKPDTPFWVIANSYEQVCSTCWYQKLQEILPAEWIDWQRISWYNSKRSWPYSVPLKPRKGSRNNWVIEFKSYEQGRELMQAAAIGGAWFTEQFPWETFTEVLRGCRENAFPGSIWMEFTPIDPAKSVEMEEAYTKWVSGDPEFDNWSFFHLNTEEALRAGHVDETWYNTFFATVSEEMLETRKRGAFASYEGTIYRSFNPRIHLVENMEVPHGVFHKRAIDWGTSEEHAFVVLWGYKDQLGGWHIYDEYYVTSQTRTIEDHAREIKERHVWPDNSPWHLQTYADPSARGLYREFAKYGVACSAARNEVIEGIETVRQHLRLRPYPDGTQRPKLYINRTRCPMLAKQMVTYRWERSSNMGVNPKDARPIPLKKDDHAVDALRYLLHTDFCDNLAGVGGRPNERKRRPGILGYKRGADRLFRRS